MPCSDNRYGSLCSKNCTCDEENTLQCNHENGFCVCKENHYGVNCEHFCDPAKNNLICSNNSTHKCSCEPTLEQRYALLKDDYDGLRSKVFYQNEMLDHVSAKSTDFSKTLEEMNDKVERAYRHATKESGLEEVKFFLFLAAEGLIVLSILCLFFYIVSRALASCLRLFRGKKSEAVVRYSKRSRENDTFDNPIYSDTLLSDETGLAKENRPSGLKSFRNPFRSNRFLDKLSKLHLIESPFQPRSQLENPADDANESGPNEVNELKNADDYETIDIGNEPSTKSEETIRMP